MEYQREKSMESRNITYDLSKPSKVYLLSPQQLLHYCLELKPAIYHKLHNVPNSKPVCFFDPNWSRDQHAILVKKKNNITKEEKSRIIAIYQQILTNKQTEKLLKITQKRITTIANKDITIKKLEEKELMGPNKEHIVEQCLFIWFSNIIKGPFFITRSLSQEKVSCSSLKLIDPTLQEIATKMGSPIKSNEIQCITMLDYKYFLIHQKEADDMDYPLDIECEFIAISDERVSDDKYTILSNIKKKSVACYDSEDSDFGYDLCLTQKEDDIFLKIVHGQRVFDDFNNELASIFNGVRFQDWCQAGYIDFEPWIGYGDVDKINDHRKLKDENKQLFIHQQQLQNTNTMLEAENDRLYEQIASLKDQLQKFTQQN